MTSATSSEGLEIPLPCESGEAAERRKRGRGGTQTPRLKLRDYSLRPDHPRGKHKARVFASVLGLTAGDAEELREVLHEVARAGEAVPTEEDEYGQRYVLDFEMETEAGTATVRSSWIVRRTEDFPQLTSCFVL